MVERLLGELRATEAAALVRRARAGRAPAAPAREDALAMLLLAAPDAVLDAMPGPGPAALAPWRRPPPPDGLLAGEVAALREQLLTLRMWRDRARGAACASR